MKTPNSLVFKVFNMRDDHDKAKIIIKTQTTGISTSSFKTKPHNLLEMRVNIIPANLLIVLSENILRHLTMGKY
jgi:hypothetical protein